MTTPAGIYAIAALPVGLYDLTVEAPGFNRKMQQGVRVQVAQTTRADVALQVGSTTESVTVKADAPLLKTENAEISMNVSGDKFNQLPLNFGAGGTGSIRSWMAFATLAPGVNGDLSTDQNASVNGLPGGMFKILVEGTDVTSSNDTRWTSTVAASLGGGHRRVLAADQQLLRAVRRRSGRDVQLHHQERRPTRSTAACTTT